MNFAQALSRAARSHKSLLCIGLDPDPQLMPVQDILAFNKAIIDATLDLACAYKPNLAFYEALGLEGWRALAGTVEYIQGRVPVIGDAKRGDVGHTARAYARALFHTLGFDAVTLNPYLGYDSLEPFLEYRERGVFLLCRTSNPGASDFQDARCQGPGGAQRLYELVAEKAREWNKEGNIGLVVGATYPQELKDIRGLCPDMLLLIPGIGPQGGDLEAAVAHGLDSRGEGAVIAVSRQVIYASAGEDFQRATREAALRIREAINRRRESLGHSW